MRLGNVGLFVLACFLVTSSFAAGVVIKDHDWPNNAPMIALDPDGTGFLLLIDPQSNRNVEATTLLRIADHQNPGLLAQFGNHLFEQWLAEGRITRRPDGTFDWGNQEAFDDLNALLRAAVITEFRPYLNQVKERLHSSDIDRVAWSGRRAAGLVRLEPLVNTWYRRSASDVVQPTVCVSTECDTCTDQNPQPYCPAGTCVVDCGGDCSNCEIIGVTPAPQPPEPLPCPFYDPDCYGDVEVARKRPNT